MEVLDVLTGTLWAVLLLLLPAWIALALTGGMVSFANRALDRPRTSGSERPFFLATLWTPLNLLGYVVVFGGATWFNPHQTGVSWDIILGLWIAGALIPVALLGSWLSIWRTREGRSLAWIVGLINLAASAFAAFLLAIIAGLSTE